jgi:peptide/nickel transport system permease protein
VIEADGSVVSGHVEARAARRRWSSLLRERRVSAGLALLVPVVAVAIFGPLFAPYDPLEYISRPFSPPNAVSLFGTDNLGRDVFSRFLCGGLTLLLLAAIATLVGVFAGAVVGSVFAYSRTRLSNSLMRLADVLLAFPPIVLALMLLGLMGPQKWIIVCVVALGHFPRSMRVIHAAALGVVERDFVQYDRSLGMGSLRIVLRDVLRNLAPQVMVEFGIRFTFSIGTIAALSFLGVGVQPPAPDWGKMIAENRIGLTIEPWGVVLPVIAIALLTIGNNLIADGGSRLVGGESGESRA